jgi:hypothetical protein
VRLKRDTRDMRRPDAVLVGRDSTAFTVVTLVVVGFVAGAAFGVERLVLEAAFLVAMHFLLIVKYNASIPY